MTSRRFDLDYLGSSAAPPRTMGESLRGLYYVGSIETLVVCVDDLEKRVTSSSVYGHLLDVASAVNEWMYLGGPRPKVVRVILPDTDAAPENYIEKE